MSEDRDAAQAAIVAEWAAAKQERDEGLAIARQHPDPEQAAEIDEAVRERWAAAKAELRKRQDELEAADAAEGEGE